jgi:hypothetical protein
VQVAECLLAAGAKVGTFIRRRAGAESGGAVFALFRLAESHGYAHQLSG